MTGEMRGTWEQGEHGNRGNRGTRETGGKGKQGEQGEQGEQGGQGTGRTRGTGRSRGNRGKKGNKGNRGERETRGTGGTGEQGNTKERQRKTKVWLMRCAENKKRLLNDIPLAEKLCPWFWKVLFSHSHVKWPKSGSKRKICSKCGSFPL